MFFILFFRCLILYYVIDYWSRKTGPKRMWDTLFKKLKRGNRKNISRKRYLLIVKVVITFFDVVVKKDKCIAQATILAYFLRSCNEVVLKMGCKNANYYRFQKISTGSPYDTLKQQKGDFHCWVTYNGEPVVQPFYEPFWTTIYMYRV
mgnify:FL=1